MVSSSSLDGIQKPILVCLLKLEENTKKEWIGWLCVWSDLLIVRWSIHSAKGQILDATSFVRIIKPIFFIISDGKIKTHIMYITSTSIHTDRKGLSSGKWGAEHLRTRIFCQSPNKLGRCDSYPQNLKTLLTHWLNHLGRFARRCYRIYI